MIKWLEHLLNIIMFHLRMNIDTVRVDNFFMARSVWTTHVLCFKLTRRCDMLRIYDCKDEKL